MSSKNLHYSIFLNLENWKPLHPTHPPSFSWLKNPILFHRSLAQYTELDYWFLLSIPREVEAYKNHIRNLRMSIITKKDIFIKTIKYLKSKLKHKNTYLLLNCIFENYNILHSEQDWKQTKCPLQKTLGSSQDTTRIITRHHRDHHKTPGSSQDTTGIITRHRDHHKTLGSSQDIRIITSHGIITRHQDHHKTPGSSQDTGIITWRWDHHKTLGSSQDLGTITWDWNHHKTLESSQDNRIITRHLDHYKTQGSSHA